MIDHQVRNVFCVLCQLIFLIFADLAQAQNGAAPDSIQHTTFSSSNTNVTTPIRPARTIDCAITGGAGIYEQGPIAPFQATASADFSGRTENLDFIAGFHWGFSKPSTKGLSVGLRFPLVESNSALNNGIYLDPSLLFFDNGGDSPAFQTGLRLALTERIAPIECRLAGELRKSPLGGDRFEGWAGFELGLFVNLITEGHAEPTWKDSLRAELHYITTSAEVEELDKTGSDREIEQWLRKFWQARSGPDVSAHSVQKEYMRRVAEANKQYGTPRKMGVSTDMGRVLLLYGEPDRTEDAASILGPQKRYELWIASNRVSGYRTAMFLFVTMLGGSGVFEESHGAYREVYSNLPGEPSDGIPGDLPATMLNYLNSFGR